MAILIHKVTSSIVWNEPFFSEYLDIRLYVIPYYVHTGVFIRFMGVELTNISRVCLSDIGEQPPLANQTVGVPDTEEGPALVCVTDNPNCCRPVDTSGSGGMGDWMLNGFPVPGSNNEPTSRIHKNRGTRLVRMNYRPGVEGAKPCFVSDGRILLHGT